MACSNFFQLLNEVLAFLSGLFRYAFFECHINSGYGSGTCQGITACCGCINERVAIHHAPDFRGGHKGTDGHYAAAQCLGRGDDIRHNIPMLNSPQFASATHTRLHFVSDEQYFVFITNLAETRPEVVGRNDGACLTLHRLHNDSSDIIANLTSNATAVLQHQRHHKAHEKRYFAESWQDGGKWPCLLGTESLRSCHG